MLWYMEYKVLAQLFVWFLYLYFIFKFSFIKIPNGQVCPKALPRGEKHNKNYSIGLWFVLMIFILHVFLS